MECDIRRINADINKFLLAPNHVKGGGGGGGGSPLKFWKTRFRDNG